MEDQIKVSDQDTKNSVPSEKNQDNINLNDKAQNDYKSDMFKFKNKYKEKESEAEELRQKLKDYENLEKQRQGNYQEVIDDLKSQLAEERERVKKTQVTTAKSRIESGIDLYAKELGCKDTKAFRKLLDNAYMDTVAIDKETLEPSLEDIKLVVESGAKKYEHLGLFGKSVNIVDGTPNNEPINMPKKKTSEMSSEELQAYIKNRFK